MSEKHYFVHARYSNATAKAVVLREDSQQKISWLHDASLPSILLEARVQQLSPDPAKHEMLGRHLPPMVNASKDLNIR